MFPWCKMSLTFVKWNISTTVVDSLVTICYTKSEIVNIHSGWLLDNAYDPDVSARQFWIDKTRIRDQDCLTFMDNGAGMDYDKMYKMLRWVRIQTNMLSYVSYFCQIFQLVQKVVIYMYWCTYRLLFLSLLVSASVIRWQKMAMFLSASMAMDLNLAPCAWEKMPLCFQRTESLCVWACCPRRTFKRFWQKTSLYQLWRLNGFESQISFTDKMYEKGNNRILHNTKRRKYNRC